MMQAEFSAAFSGSPIKRAKPRGLKRNAALMLGNVGTADDVGVLTRALDDAEPLVCERARGRSRASVTAARRPSYP